MFWYQKRGRKVAESVSLATSLIVMEPSPSPPSTGASSSGFWHSSEASAAAAAVAEEGVRERRGEEASAEGDRERRGEEAQELAAHADAAKAIDRMTVGIGQGSLDDAPSPLYFEFLDCVNLPPPNFLESMKPIIDAGIFLQMERVAASLYDRAKTAKDHGKLAEDTLCIERIAALMTYSNEKPSIYADMNNKCYERDRTLIAPYKGFILLLLAALRELPPYSRNQIYRGVKMDLRAKYPKGRRFTWHGFISCTKSINVLSTAQFCGDSGPRTIFSIELSQGQARDISPYSVLSKEDEILLPPGSTFQVTGVLPQGDLTIVSLLEVESKDWIRDLRL